MIEGVAARRAALDLNTGDRQARGELDRERAVDRVRVDDRRVRPRPVIVTCGAVGAPFKWSMSRSPVAGSSVLKPETAGIVSLNVPAGSVIVLLPSRSPARAGDVVGRLDRGPQRARTTIRRHARQSRRRLQRRIGRIGHGERRSSGRSRRRSEAPNDHNSHQQPPAAHARRPENPQTRSTGRTPGLHSSTPRTAAQRLAAQPKRRRTPAPGIGTTDRPRQRGDSPSARDHDAGPRPPAARSSASTAVARPPPGQREAPAPSQSRGGASDRSRQTCSAGTTRIFSVPPTSLPRAELAPAGDCT